MKTIFFLMLFAYSTLTFGQFELGMQVGVNYNKTQLVVAPKNGITTIADPCFGFQEGIYAQLNVFKYFLLKGETNYLVKGYNVDNAQTKVKYEHKYINFTPQLGVILLKHFKFLIGLETNFLLNNTLSDNDEIIIHTLTEYCSSIKIGYTYKNLTFLLGTSKAQNKYQTFKVAGSDIDYYNKNFNFSIYWAINKSLKK